MTLDKRVQSLLSKSVLAEVKDFQGTAKEEDWQWQPNTYETLNHFFDITEGKDSVKYTRALNKVERAIGIQRQVKEGEQIVQFSYRGSFMLKVGTWIHNKRYDELEK